MKQILYTIRFKGWKFDKEIFKIISLRGIAMFLNTARRAEEKFRRKLTQSKPNSCIGIYILALTAPFTLFSYEVISYGDAIIDYFVFVEEEFLDKLPGERGGTEQIDLQTFKQLTKGYKKRCAGGSAPNTVKGLAQYGHSCAIIGRIGNDKEGAEYALDLVAQGISPLFTPHETDTGRVVCMISPDGHRTMRTCIGELVGFDGFEVDESIFQNAKLFHIEGYQIPNPKFLRSLIGIAKKHGLKISMDVGCHELVKAYKTTLLDLIEKDLDILFTNEEEAKALTGLFPKEACDQLSTLCPTVVVTMGENGGYVASKGRTIYYPPKKARLVDDTGAGDLFMAGFLHGILDKSPIEECARYGAEIASKVIQIVGAELPKEGNLSLQQIGVGHNH